MTPSVVCNRELHPVPARHMQVAISANALNPLLSFLDWGFTSRVYTFPQDVKELAKGGMMDKKETSKRSKGLFGDVADLFGALSGGAHIVKREDGTL